MNQKEKEEFALAVYVRLFPKGKAFICSEWEIRIESPNGQWMQCSIGAILNRYRDDNLPFSDQQTVDEIDSQLLWIDDELAPLLPTFRKPKQPVS